MQIIIKLKVPVISDEICEGDRCRCVKLKSNSNFRHGIEWKLILLENAGDGGLKGAYFAPVYLSIHVLATFSAERLQPFSEIFAFLRVLPCGRRLDESEAEILSLLQSKQSVFITSLFSAQP